MRVLTCTHTAPALLLSCSDEVEIQPQWPFISLGLGPLSREEGMWMDSSARLCSPLLPSPVDSSQQVRLCLRLQRGRHLLVVMYSHHPSPGGLPPLISTPRLVTGCSSRSESAGRRQHWLQTTQFNVLSIDSRLDSRRQNGDVCSIPKFSPDKQNEAQRFTRPEILNS